MVSAAVVSGARALHVMSMDEKVFNMNGVFVLFCSVKADKADSIEAVSSLAACSILNTRPKLLIL